MRIAQKLEKIVTTSLLNGRCIKDAGVLTISQLEELLSQGADANMLAGWLQGFEGGKPQEKYKGSNSYLEGYNCGLELRKKLESKFLN